MTQLLDEYIPIIKRLRSTHDHLLQFLIWQNQELAEKGISWKLHR